MVGEADLAAAWAWFVHWLVALPVPLWLAAAGAGFAVVNVAYFVHGCMWLPLDLYHWPKFLYKYKLQKEPLDPSVLPRMWRVLLWGMVLGLAPVAAAFGAATAAGRVRVTPELPPLREVVVHFVAFILMEEVMFFYSHKILHLPALYSRFHKIHHEFKQPIALAAGYAHPVEVLIGNTLPLYMQPVIMGAHLSTALLWLLAATVVTQVHHSGFRMPWNLGAQPDFHDFHHHKEGFKSNYGLLGILDWLHGSDLPYKRFLARQQKQHQT